MGVNSVMKKILVRGPGLSQSGYGEHTRFVLRSLRAYPDLFDIYFINLNWGNTGWVLENTEEREWIDSLIRKTIVYGNSGGQFDVSVQVAIPNEFQKLAPYNIGITAGTETTKLSPEWVKACYVVDKIITISEHAKYAFENTKYPAINESNGQNFIAECPHKLDVVGYPVKKVEAKKINLNFKHQFNYLFVGTYIPRKNIQNTVKWFIEQFHDEEVGLVMKTTHGKNSLLDRKKTERALSFITRNYPDKKCSIELLHGELSEAEMTYLYNHKNIKAMVSLSHGEGFGLPMFEAAYNGLPIICPDWGGQIDYLYIPNKKTGKKKAMFSKVSYNIQNIQKEAVWDGVLQKDSQWCFPVEWHFKKVIRDFKKNYTARQSDARKLKKYLEENFSQEKQYEKMVNAISPNASSMNKTIDEMFLELEQG
jgi:glycosyltransferase involved in cell wall biosynthesis